MCMNVIFMRCIFKKYMIYLLLCISQFENKQTALADSTLTHSGMSGDHCSCFSHYSYIPQYMFISMEITVEY